MNRFLSFKDIKSLMGQTLKYIRALGSGDLIDRPTNYTRLYRDDSRNKNGMTSNGQSNWDLMKAQLATLFEQDRVNIEELNSILLNYKSDEKDWGPYAYFDPYRYTRNLIDKGNGKYNLMLLCWGPNMVSSIHDHSNAHCFVKVLQGRLSEELYQLVDDFGEAKTYKTGHNVYVKDQVSYINDSIGLHRMANQDNSVPAVSLHLYCPPFDSCRIFDDRTGRVDKCQVLFYSQFGTRIGPILGPDMDRLSQKPVGVSPPFIETK